jgi:hypothetical protein
MMRLDGRWVYRRYAAHFLDAFSRAHQTPPPEQLPVQRHCG